MPDHLLDGLSPAQIAGVKASCEQSQHYFTRFMFKALEGHAFRVGRHHKLIDDTLDQVISGDISRLIVNEPPGYSKTLQCVLMFVARGYALNPRCRFLHVSYSQELVLQNSATIRDIIGLPEYQILWPRSLRADTSAKNLWRTPEGGTFKASAAGGSITGFRAGTMDELADEIAEDLNGIEAGEEKGVGFSGALIIDDPLKPDDASSDVTREFINARYQNTLRSRLAHERVPIIVDMQRVHAKDFSAHLLTGGGGEKFHHLMLPVEIDNSRPYPSEYTFGVPIKHGLPDGPLWEAKHNSEQIDVLRRDGRVFSAQYMQDPRVSENAIFKPSAFHAYEVRPRTLNIAIVVDPSSGKAMTVKRDRDRTAMAVLGIDANANKYLLDGFCHRMTLSERWENLKRLWTRWSVAPGVVSMTVGYEQYGMQADLAYIEERQQLDGVMFHIEELGGPQSKPDRIQRLEPDVNGSRMHFSAVAYRPEEGGTSGRAFWTGSERGLVYRPAYGSGTARTSAQKRVTDAGENWRCADALTARDENNQVYDLTLALLGELQDFPNATHDDLSDAVSRIYDLDVMPVNRNETDEVMSLNESLVS